MSFREPDLSLISGRVLLVDDIITTRTTMPQFMKLVKDHPLTPFAFGLNPRLNPEQTGAVILEEEKLDLKDYTFDSELEDIEIDLDYEFDLGLI